MKRIFLLTALVSLSITSVFSQVTGSTKLDSISTCLSIFKITKPIIQGDPYDFKIIFDKNLVDNKLFLPNFSHKKRIDKDYFITIYNDPNFYDPMLCIKPEGFFSMRIYRPKENLKYALLNQ